MSNGATTLSKETRNTGFLIAGCLTLLQYSINSTNIGAITEASFNVQGLGGVGINVICAAMGSLVAFFITTNNASNAFIRRKARSSGFYLVLSASSVLLSIVPRFTPAWFLLFILFHACAALVVSILMSSAAMLSKNYVQLLNKYFQVASTIGTLIGITLAPIFVLKAGYRSLLIVSSVLIVFFSVALPIVMRNLEEFKGGSVSNRFQINRLKKHFRLFFLILLVWVLGGFFYVIEIPLLKNRFDANAEAISFVFFLSVGFNLLGIVLLKSKIASRYIDKLYISVSFGCAVIAVAYAFNTGRYFVPLIVSAYGILNGLFNLSTSSIIQNFEDQSLSIMGFSAYRLITQLGLIISSLLCFGKDIDSVPSLMLKILLVGGGIFFLSNLRKSKT